MTETTFVTPLHYCELETRAEGLNMMIGHGLVYCKCRGLKRKGLAVVLLGLVAVRVKNLVARFRATRF